MSKRRWTSFVICLALGGAALAGPASAAAPPAGPQPTVGTTPAMAPLVGHEDDGVSLDGDYVVAPGPLARGRYQRYPGKTIRYWVDAPRRFDWAIARGAEAWNDTGLGIRFVETSRARAQLTIRTVKSLRGALGLATLGYSREARWRWVKLDVDQLSANDVWRGFTLEEREVFTAAVVAHELGHTLGLDHAGSRCVLMHPTIYGGTCPFFADEVGFYNCQLVDGMSLGRARRIYGGTRKLAPESCPLDPLPPRLTGVAVSGGGPDAEPGAISWDAPQGQLPGGSRIQVLVRRDDSCDLSPRAPLKRMASYPDRISVHLLPTSARRFELDAVRNEERVCLGASLVNASGGGQAPVADKVTLYTPQPQPPVVHVVRNSYSDPDTFRVRLDVPDGPDGQPIEDVYYAVGPEGECPGTSPGGAGWELAWLDGEDGAVAGELYGGDAGADPCFAFATYDRGRYSEVVTYQTGDEEPPSAPAVGAVRRDPQSGGYLITSADGEPFPHDVLALVRPQGECAPTTWPAEESKDDALAYDEGEGTYRAWEEAPIACVTVYLVDGSGRVGPGVAVQTEPADPPTKPVISAVTTVDDYTIRFDADYDEANDRLEVVVAPQGECVTAWADDVFGEFVWEDGGHFFVENWNAFEHPCISVFAVNADGLHSAPAIKQL